MVEHQVECLCSLISFLVHLFNVVRKALLFNNLFLTHHRKPVLASVTKGTISCNNFETNSISITTSSVNINVEDVMNDQVEKTVVTTKKVRRRPSKIVIPAAESSTTCADLGFCDQQQVLVAVKEKDLEVEGFGYCLASRKGKRHVMEDGYGVITHINGDSKQAFFGVFDGHGGRAAVDFVSEKLGKNIIRAAAEMLEQGGDDKLEMAIRSAYLTTDKEFRSKGVSSGACVVTVLLKGRELHVSNAGDCRVVMSKNGEAQCLTNDHRPGREDERNRIESLGGYVSCRNGMWRVQDSLAVSRSIGDVNMKEWVISEPDTNKLHLTDDCHFLILASDGLWDKVSDQEAVDVVERSRRRRSSSISEEEEEEAIKLSCKELVEISCSRGSRDDITVMVVDLHQYITCT